MKIFLIQTGQTAWEADSRIESPAGSALTESGARSAETVAGELATAGIKAIYTCPSEAAQQTARVISRALHVKVHTDEAMGEPDYGLWQGLTIAEIKHRQPRLYKQWIDDPTTTCPPSGETIQDAQSRLKGRIANIARKPRNTPAALVLRPVAVGLLRCLFGGVALEQLWQHVDKSFTWAGFEIDVDRL